MLRAHSIGGDGYTFDRTVVPLQLMTDSHTGLESRAQAKRVATRLHSFRRAELDFTGVKGDGYILKTLDPNTTFSPVESLRMVLSRSILPSGVDDSPLNSVQLPGQALRISYEYAEVIDTLQGLASSDTERVVNSSPLARHLIPHFVRFDLEYTGGSREEDIQPELETMIRNTPPSDPLYSSEVQDIVRGRGATSIRNPIDLIAVTYHPDRRVRLDRSQDSVSTGRLSAFFPDRVKLVRRAR